MTFHGIIPTKAVFAVVLSGVEGGIQYWARVISLWIPARSGSPDECETNLRFACDFVELDSARRISLREPWPPGFASWPMWS
jgi:hypothetical protein